MGFWIERKETYAAAGYMHEGTLGSCRALGKSRE